MTRATARSKSSMISEIVEGTSEDERGGSDQGQDERSSVLSPPDQNEYKNMQIGRVVEADSIGLRVEYQDGTSETHPISFMIGYFVITMEFE